MLPEMAITAAVTAAVVFLICAARGYVDSKGRNESPVARPADRLSHFWEMHHDFPVDVVTHERYRRAIEALGDDAGGSRSNIGCVAGLIPVRRPLFPVAEVNVVIFGRQVGALSKGDARRFLRRLKKHGLDGETTICSALVSYGGGYGAAPFHYTVRLALEPLTR